MSLQKLHEAIEERRRQAGRPWEVSPPKSTRRMGDWRIGRIDHPTLSLGDAVAASSAFPPFLSPLSLKLEPASFTLRGGIDLNGDDLRRQVFLSDGSVQRKNWGSRPLCDKRTCSSATVETSSPSKSARRETGPSICSASPAPSIGRSAPSAAASLIAAYRAPAGSKEHRGGAF